MITFATKDDFFEQSVHCDKCGESIGHGTDGYAVCEKKDKHSILCKTCFDPHVSDNPFLRLEFYVRMLCGTLGLRWWDWEKPKGVRTKRKGRGRSVHVKPFVKVAGRVRKQTSRRK